MPFEKAGRTTRYALATPLTGLEMAGLPVASGTTLDEFGFMTMERHGPHWKATLRDVEDKELLKCTLDDDTLICKPKKKAHGP